MELRGEIVIGSDRFDRVADREAFADVVQRFGPDVRRLCSVVTLDRDLAREAEQSAWARAWQKRHFVRDPDRMRAWVLRVAANEARQLLRHRRRHPTSPLDTAPESGSWESDPHRHAELRDALRRLDPADRELLALRYVLDLDSAAIGAQLGLSAEGVRSRLKRVRDRLHRELRADD